MGSTVTLSWKEVQGAVVAGRSERLVYARASSVLKFRSTVTLVTSHKFNQVQEQFKVVRISA